MKIVFQFLKGLFFSQTMKERDLDIVRVLEPTANCLEAIEKEMIDLSDNAYSALCEEILKNENISIQEYDFLTGETESYSY